MLNFFVFEWHRLPVFWFCDKPQNKEQTCATGRFIILFLFGSRHVWTFPIQANFRSRGFAPALSDEEVITMEIVVEFMGIDGEKASGLLKFTGNTGFQNRFEQNFAHRLPILACEAYSATVSQPMLQQQTSFHGYGFPVPVCTLRPGFSKVLRWCQLWLLCLKRGNLLGFKGTWWSVLKVLLQVTLTLPMWIEASIWDIVDNIQGLRCHDWLGPFEIELKTEASITHKRRCARICRKTRQGWLAGIKDAWWKCNWSVNGTV